MNRDWSKERIARAALWAILSLAVLVWLVRRYIDGAEVALLNSLVIVLLLIALPIGIFVARHPREIPRTGDSLIDDEIDSVLRRRSDKNDQDH
jgi:hypothetical protein